MNKKIYFILLPILVLLLSMSSKVECAFPVQQTGFSFSKNIAQTSLVHTIDLNKDSRKIKNKIRIKACDNSFALDFHPILPSYSKFFHVAGPLLGEYLVYTPSRNCHSRNLRGPPAVI